MHEQVLSLKPVQVAHELGLAVVAVEDRMLEEWRFALQRSRQNLALRSRLLCAENSQQLREFSIADGLIERDSDVVIT